MDDNYELHYEPTKQEQEQEQHQKEDKNKACRKCLGIAAIVLTLGMVAALLVAGVSAGDGTTSFWSYREGRRTRGNFLHAANLDYVDNLGYIYYDTSDSRVYVFTGVCENNSGVLASTWGLDCGTYDTVCPTNNNNNNDEGNNNDYSFCVCGAAWRVTLVDNHEVLTIKTPYCTMSQTFMEEYRGVVIYADLVVQNRGYVVAPIAVDFSMVQADSDTFVQDVADIILRSDDYQSIVNGDQN